MKYRHQKIRTSKTGHIYTCGNPSTATYSWLAFHGYGQLASKMLTKFANFSDTAHYVVAPEGLNRFYWEGVNEKPVASWMTSLDRQDEIADYVHYLDQVDHATGWSKGKGKVKMILAFSQGCATVWRWLLNTRPKFDYLLLWAGWLPEDMGYAQHLDYLQNIRIHYIHGFSDEYLSPERMALLRQRFRQEQIPVTYHSFDGNHRIPPVTFYEIFSRITRDDK